MTRCESYPPCFGTIYFPTAPFYYYVFGNSCYYQLLPVSVKLRFGFFSPCLKSLKYHIVSIITIIK